MNLTLDQYQVRALETSVIKTNDNLAIYEAMFGLAEEAGEVCGKLKRVIRDGKSIEDYRQALEDELGDVLWYTAVLAHRLGFSFEDVAMNNLHKLADRAKRGVISGEGDKR